MMLPRGFATSRAAEAGVVFFENRVRPVLVEHCYECHSKESKTVKGGLRVDSRESLLLGGDSGPALVPGDPTKSLLLRAVRHESKDLAMPSRKPKLPDAILADLAEWVKQGAPFPSAGPAGPDKPHWAFQPVRNPARPLAQSSWPRTSVDHFILEKLEKQSLTPAPAADKRTLLRRASYGLTGLPPTAEETEAFENDSSPDAFAKAVDQLLASPHYGERWGRHWLDIARYADTAGETADYPLPTAWRYRNYVIAAFNTDKPYDQFLREQIAGDILAKRGPRDRYGEQVTATGYLAISRRFGFDSENYHHLTIQDTIDTLGQTVLGLTLGCARCHAHKFDPISTADYYALYGIFESTRYAFPGSEQKQKSRALVPLLPPEESQPRWRDFDARVAVLTAQLKQKKQSFPAAVLRSLDDLDGDFEMQAQAAGGSKGVLVAPWVYEGPIAVTQEAQSPFTNFHAPGRAGASVPAGTTNYHMGQALHPQRHRGEREALRVSLDFRVATNATTATGSHRFWIGGSKSSPAVEVLISAEAIALHPRGRIQTVRSVTPGQWYQLRLDLDLKRERVSGSVGIPGDILSFRDLPFSEGWTGLIDFAGMDARGRTGSAVPGIAFDNLGVQETPFAPISVAAPSTAPDAEQPDTERIKRELNELFAEGPLDLAYAVVEGTPRDARIQLRGEPDKPGEEVRRGFLKVLGGETLAKANRGSGRLELAEWLTRRTNPLTARVMVNRIWQHHFGQGLVKTPNDFGSRGMAPSHPELLDHLASRFMEGGWSIKAMHRLIMLSATYQQSSGGDPPSATREDCFSPFARRRLGAEEARDSMLLASGELDRSPGRGHPFPKPASWGFTQHAPFSAVYDHPQRSVYLMTQRIKRHPFLALFDGADPNASTAERRATTVPTQALYFLNDPFVHANAAKLAARAQERGMNPSGRVEAAYRAALGRPPSEAERAEALDFLDACRAELRASGEQQTEAASLAALARVLFGSNEFLTVD